MQSAGNAAGEAASGASSSLSKPQLIGVIVAIIGIFAIIVGSVWYCCVRAAKRRDSRHMEEAQAPRPYRVQPTTDQAATYSYNVPMAEMEHERPYDHQRGQLLRNNSDEDWKREPLTHADEHHVWMSNGTGYVEDANKAPGRSDRAIMRTQ